MLKVLELFGGIGACTQALKRIGVDFEIADYVEIDKHAVNSYNAINGTNFEPQDITKWDKNIEVDLIMHGSPCQDFSLAGKQAGGDEGSGTRSSLMYETVRIVEKLRPKYVVWENVKNVLSKRHRHNFDAYLDKMASLGYVNHYQVLNTKHYGIPQNRERVFCVSILNGGSFEFPEKMELKLRLKDMLEAEVDEKYYLSDELISKIINWKAHQRPLTQVLGTESVCRTLTARGAGEYHSGMILYDENFETTTNVEEKILIKNANKKGYDEAHEGDSVNLEQPNSKTRRGRVGHGVAQTLNTGCNQGVVVSNGPSELQREVCNKAIEKGLVEPNDVIEYTFSNARLKEIEQGYIRKQNKNDNSIMSTLVTKPDKLGICVEVTGAAMRGRNPENPSDRTAGVPTEQRLELRKDEVSNCLTTVQKDSLVAEHEPRVLRIRKLTPKECWRLQGFSKINEDGSFDDSVFENAEKVCSNTHLYRQAGNSITVDVLAHIFTNLLKEEEEMKKVSEKKTVTIETDKMIDLVALQEKEPELFEELVEDYPCEDATYIFEVKAE